MRAARLPGFARQDAGRRLDQRLLVLLVSAGVSAVAVALHTVAQDRHDSYLEYQARPIGPLEIDTEMQRLHRSAEQMRHLSVNVGAIGALVWVGQGLLAPRAERRLAGELRDIQGLGRPTRSSRFTPSFSATSVGLTLTYMVRPSMRRSTLPPMFVLAIAAGSCNDGPFAHRNPNDLATLFTMRLEADKDTTSPGDPAVQYTLITEPAFPGYAPLWNASIDTLVYHTQNGRFLVTDIPESVITVQISASFMNQSVSRALVIRPTP